MSTRKTDRPFGVAQLTGLLIIGATIVFLLRPYALVLNWVETVFGIPTSLTATGLILSFSVCGCVLLLSKRVLTARIYFLLTLPILLFGVGVMAYALWSSTSSLLTGYLLICLWATLQFLFDLEEVIRTGWKN